ncbi:hypothetical protein KTI19_17715 [Acinetobacter baumannii]|nr:hypothetical protein [Acinetobacter baumannii]
MLKQFQPVTDHTEFNKLVHDMEPIKGEFQQLLNDYKYLNDRFNDLDNPMTDGEFDWWGITRFRLESIYRFINNEFINVLGSDNAVKIQLSVAGDKLISDLYEKIHDRRQLGIENDPVVADLYNEVRKAKLIIGRE